MLIIIPNIYTFYRQQDRIGRLENAFRKAGVHRSLKIERADFETGRTRAVVKVFASCTGSRQRVINVRGRKDEEKKSAEVEEEEDEKEERRIRALSAGTRDRPRKYSF